MPTQSASSTPVSNDSLLELFDRYVRRTADIWELPNILTKKELVNKLDLSRLSPADQGAFWDWLNRRPYMQMSIGNLLRRGLWIEVGLVETTTTIDYSVRIKSV